MAAEIITSINSLNLYTIRYITLLHLLQDIILEPPHPWIVNLQTIERVSQYNFERALHHIQNTQTSSVQGNPALLLHAYYEYFRHICATILSKYGAFLGVGERYGLLELKRIINLKNNNRPLWTYCRIHDLEKALCSINMDLNSLTNCLDRIWHLLRISKTDKNQFQSLGQNAQLLKNLVEHLFPDLVETPASKGKRSGQEQCLKNH